MNDKTFTKFTLVKANMKTNTRSILAVSYLRSKGWKVLQSNLGELI